MVPDNLKAAVIRNAFASDGTVQADSRRSHDPNLDIWAVAIDDAGQESTSEEVALPVSLLPPGYNDPLTGTRDPLIAEVWSEEFQRTVISDFSGSRARRLAK